MAKTDKSNKKSTSKRAEPTKGKAASSKEILAKAAALAQPAPEVQTGGKKKPSTSSNDSSGSSSEESDSDVKAPPTKKAQPIKKKPAVPPASKQNPVKVASLAKPASTKAQISSSDEESSGEESDDSKASPSTKSPPVAVKGSADSLDDSSDSSNSEESSSEESETGVKAAQVKTTLAAAKKTADSSDDSSDESSSEDGDNDKEMAPVPEKVSSAGAKTTSDSDDDSSGSDSNEGEDDKPSPPVHTVSAEVNKKRQADSEAAAPSKKAKLANGSTNAPTSDGEAKGIFVASLSWNVDNDWLAREFAECGEVESAHVQVDRNSGQSRGFGYVNFKTADAVDKAIALSGKTIDGRAIHVDKRNPPDKTSSTEKRPHFGDTRSPPSTVLFVGNLSFGVNEDALWETFGEHGDVKSVRVPTDRDSGKPKGFAYVEFSEVGAAKRACDALHGFELDGRSMRLDFSQPRDSAGGRGGQGGRGGRGRGGFGGDRGRGGDRGGRGGRGGDRGRGARGRGARTGGITQFEGRKTTFG